MSFASTEYTVREGQEWVVLQLVRDGDTSRHTTVTVSAAYSPSPEAGMGHVFKLQTFVYSTLMIAIHTSGFDLKNTTVATACFACVHFKHSTSHHYLYQQIVHIMCV